MAAFLLGEGNQVLIELGLERLQFHGVRSISAEQFRQFPKIGVLATRRAEEDEQARLAGAVILEAVVHSLGRKRDGAGTANVGFAIDREFQLAFEHAEGFIHFSMDMIIHRARREEDIIEFERSIGLFASQSRHDMKGTRIKDLPLIRSDRQRLNFSHMETEHGTAFTSRNSHVEGGPERRFNARDVRLMS